MSRTKLAIGAATALVAVFVVAACTSSSKSPNSAASKVSADGGGVAGGSNTAVGGARSADSAAGKVPAGAPKDGSVLSAPTLVSTALIRIAELTVEIPHGHSVAPPADQAEQIALAAGGQVFADERSAGRSPTATITLKVPGDSLADVVEKLAALGKEKARHSSTRDVTTEVADVSSRVRSAQASIAELRLLFDRAVKVGDVIILERELSDREADLESLQAQQRALDAQTSMATVTLNLTTAGAAAAVHHKHRADGGFIGGLERGWHAFQTAASGLATGVGAVLPFLVLALVVAAAGVALRRRYRRAVPTHDPAAGEA